MNRMEDPVISSFLLCNRLQVLQYSILFLLV